MPIKSAMCVLVKQDSGKSVVNFLKYVVKKKAGTSPLSNLICEGNKGLHVPFGGGVVIKSVLAQHESKFPNQWTQWSSKR